ncbi:Nif11-like leader peptide family natural product precursor [Roseomonas populi]|uniref:Nif11-like leader peptide family natural product n=1 Tax=Roseomonas populi TaxID=3121582 RepID=A0ABT1X642_9PROT|nr:Nif11-like leader peptide family natural product precursor [Roseomonas pecuniae]MCR0983564.1 Nif11-like leader peptide family natural product precursor [Roseomonas pecuniae]
MPTEMQRLKQDLEADPALRARLAPALDASADPEAASALLRAAGYGIAPGELPLSAQGPRRLNHADLDQVAGGRMTLKNPTNPFDEPL